MTAGKLTPQMLNNLIKEGKVSEVVPMYLNKRDFSDMFGWTPKQIDEQKIEDMLAYEAIDIGRMEGEKIKEQMRKLKKLK